jgi:hypothetical protein
VAVRASPLGGGGNTTNADLAVAGGRDASRIDDTLDAARAALASAGSGAS